MDRWASGRGLYKSPADKAAAVAKEMFATLQPIPRAGVTDDIARAAVFLANDGSSFVNGHDLVVDGGARDSRMYAYLNRARPTVTPLGRASDRGHGQMVAWAMADGHLTKIIKGTRGYAVSIVEVDPLRLMCTFRYEIHPNEQGMFATFNSTVRDMQITSSACEVTRGNIFGSN